MFVDNFYSIVLQTIKDDEKKQRKHNKCKTKFDVHDVMILSSYVKEVKHAKMS